MEPVRLSNKHILVVEDNNINQMLVDHLLRHTGATIDIAEDGRIALSKLKETYYDFILMDIHLPEMDGYETTYILRNELQIHVPVIGMSATMFSDEKEKCRACGMNGYLLKPFTLESLYESISETFKTVNEKTLQDEYLLGNAELTIDLSFLYTFGKNEFGYVESVIKTFLDTMPDTIRKMDEQCSKEQYDDLLKTAHFAKSSLSVVKVRQLLELVQSIEWQCRTLTSLHTINKKIEIIKEKYPLAELLLKEKFNTALSTKDIILN